MKLGARLLLPPLVASVVALVGAGAYVAIDNQAIASAREASTTAVATVETVGQTRTALSQARGDVFRTLTLIASMEEAEVQQARDAVVQSIGAVGGRLTTLDGTPDAERESLGALLSTYAQQCKKAIDLSGMDPNVGAGAMRAAEDTYAADCYELALEHQFSHARAAAGER